MTDDVLYRLIDVKKRFGHFVLDIQQLVVHRGEILGLLGPTGAGKSTLLRLLGGLLRPDQGEIFFDCHPFARVGLSLANRRRTTLVHQRPLLLSGTVRFNVEYGLRLRKQKTDTNKVDNILDRLGLSRLAAQSASTLSGGQAQLVALARALVIEPDVLLLDEPTTHLDPANVALAEKTILHDQMERNVTVVWATHNPFQARRMTTRSALLLNGQLVEASQTEKFFTDPANPGTADFVQGRMVH